MSILDVPVTDRRPPPTKHLNDLLSIWFAPRTTMRRILDADDYAASTYVLAGAYGVLVVLNKLPVTTSLPLMFGLALLLGPVVGILLLSVGGMLASVVGRMLGGEGTPEQLRGALAWGAVPAIMGWSIGLPTLTVFMRHAQQVATAGNTDSALTAEMLVTSIAVLIALTGGAWSLFTTAKCVAEAHAFSFWRAVAVYVVLVAGSGVLLVLAGLIIGG